MANPFDAVTSSLKLTSASEQLQSLRAINDTLMAESLNAMQSVGQLDNGRGTGGNILDAVGGALAGGLGLSSLISGVADLFGGGGSPVPAPPVPYLQPLPIHLDAAFSASDGGAAFGTDVAEGGAPRAMTSAGTASGSSASGSPAQITVQVQALDSQSFLDRSQDIAMAVRQAMLESTVLNDVIREV
ncbi:MAG TPA: hypothetical protein VGR73_01870 [Bryobacteraceae bacterium]|nr:hypothetical protein [Bryobacteraceae bacterium]